MNILNLKLKSLPFVTAILFLAITVSSCSKNVRFLNSSIVPAAEGKVKISKTDNGNYELHLNIINLAEPSKLTPPKKSYVVWLLTSDNRVQSLGQLRSSSGYFSSLLKAEMRATTPYKPAKVFITGEDSPLVANPGPVVFTTDAF